MPEKEHLKAFRYDPAEGQIDEVPAAASDLIVPDGMPGAALSLSANSNQDGIVWASFPIESQVSRERLDPGVRSFSTKLMRPKHPGLKSETWATHLTFVRGVASFSIHCS
jgi:hypothetical protein